MLKSFDNLPLTVGNQAELPGGFSIALRFVPLQPSANQKLQLIPSTDGGDNLPITIQNPMPLRFAQKIEKFKLLLVGAGNSAIVQGIVGTEPEDQIPPLWLSPVLYSPAGFGQLPVEITFGTPTETLFDNSGVNGAGVGTGHLDISGFAGGAIIAYSDDVAVRSVNLAMEDAAQQMIINLEGNTRVVPAQSAAGTLWASWGSFAMTGPAGFRIVPTPMVNASIGAGTAGKTVRLLVVARRGF